MSVITNISRARLIQALSPPWNKSGNISAEFKHTSDVSNDFKLADVTEKIPQRRARDLVRSFSRADTFSKSYYCKKR